MAITILEALENSELNLSRNNPFSRTIGQEQLHNAIGLLIKGYSVYDLVEPLLEQYGSVESVPEKP